MGHIYYKEEQRFTRVAWIWVIIAIVMTLMITVIVLDKNTSENYLQLSLMLAASLVPVGILLISKLELKVDDQGFHYRFFPRVLKWKRIPTEMIESFEVREKKNWYEQFACGYKRYVFKNTIFMNISGKKFIWIKLVDGKKLKIGAENAEGIELELKRLTMSSDN